MKSVFFKNSVLALTLLASTLASFVGSVPSYAQTQCMKQCASQSAAKTYAARPTWDALNGEINFYIANDLGRNGYYQQKPIAELMGEMADAVNPECVIAAGDIHHFNGVTSVNDPLWMTNYELVYSHPELMLDWFAVCGNHEYRGNTQAVLDYGKVSRRWVMPSKYYTKVYDHKGTSIRIVFLDTTPLIDKYRETNEKYPDACKEDMQKQLSWLDQTLKGANEDWVVVVGHHPIYAETGKSVNERLDMQKRVMPLLHKYNNVAMYVCGHIHNFQHIQMKGDNIDYIVNSSASLARKVKPVEGTVFCSPAEGFSVLTADKKQLRLSMIDKDGNIIHTVTKNK